MQNAHAIKSDNLEERTIICDTLQLYINPLI
jgi:hypothetical protein